MFHRNARFPCGPSALAFALKLDGSILNTTGPVLRDLAGRELQDKCERGAARLRPGTEWFVTGRVAWTVSMALIGHTHLNSAKE